MVKDKKFTIHMGTFDYKVAFFIGSIPGAIKYIHYMYEYRLRGMEMLKKDTLSGSYGMCFNSRGYIPIIWLPSVPKTPREYGTLYHEIFHAVYTITEWAGITLSSGSEEVYAHMGTYLMTKALTKMK